MSTVFFFFFFDTFSFFLPPSLPHFLSPFPVKFSAVDYDSDIPIENALS